MDFHRKDITLDYRLGYIRAETSLSGFDFIGEINAPRILILGGYTTTEQAVSKKTWVDSLYNIFKDNNQPVQIINGDTDGFTTAQEMMMLIRDGILLKPELVICFSGFYNFAYKLGFVKNRDFAETLKDYPFTNLGQLELYKHMSCRLGLGQDKMYYGEQNNLSAWDYWISHVDIIHCICEEFEINHMTILQPCIFSGKYVYSHKEKESLKTSYDFPDEKIKHFRTEFQQIYKNTVDASKGRNYIVDASCLFDKYTDVYIDDCHVCEKYNFKIAEMVYNNIRGIITNGKGIE